MGLEQYIISLIDDSRAKVKLVEGVYHITAEITSTKPTYVDAMVFQQVSITERINKKLKIYLPLDVEYQVFVYVKPNLIVSQRPIQVTWM